MSKSKPWHAWEREQVIAELETTEQGLTYALARQRLRTYGKNIFPKTPSLPSLIWRSLTPVWGWIGLGLALQWVGELGSVVLLGVGVSKGVEVGCQYWLNGLEKRATLARWDMILPDSTAIVLRDQEWLEISSRLLVVGDLILVRAGDHPPADVRLLDASPDLVANEVMIGCGAIAPKQAEQALPVDTPLYQRSNMVYAGTEIVSGLGVGLVVAVGKETTWQSQQQPPPIKVWEIVHWRNWRLWAVAVCSLVCVVAGWSKGVYYSLFLGMSLWLAGYSCPEDLLARLLIWLGIKTLAYQRVRINHPAAVPDLTLVDAIELLDCDREVKRDGELWRLGVRLYQNAPEVEPSLMAQLKTEATLEVLDLPPPNLADEDLSGYITRVEAEEEEETAVTDSPAHLAVYCRTLDYPERLQSATVSVCDRASPRPLQQSVDVVLPQPHLRHFSTAIKGALIYTDRTHRLQLFLTTGLVSLLSLVTFAALMGFPMTPAQIIWLGSIAVPMLAVSFVHEPDPDKPPLQFLEGAIPLVSAVCAIDAAVISLFVLKYQGQISALNSALTMSFTTLFLAQIFHAIALSRASLIQHWVLTLTGLVLAVLQVLFVQVSPLDSIWQFVPLNGAEWLIVGFAATSVLWVQEILRAS
ncbi:MAG: cation transporting ATPase C-terminal domain-containing protein [Pseudanabaenaceae cyanobacterium]